MTIADKLKYWFCLNSLLIASLYNSHPFGSRKGGRFAQVWLYLHYSVKRLKINVVHIKTDELVNILDRITFQPISPSWLDVCSTNDKVVLSIIHLQQNLKYQNHITYSNLIFFSTMAAESYREYHQSIVVTCLEGMHEVGPFPRCRSKTRCQNWTTRSRRSTNGFWDLDDSCFAFSFASWSNFWRK